MEKISAPGMYKGYSEAIYDDWKRFSEYVTMRDGVKLAVDYYRPMRAGKTEEKPLPVVWLYTPYDYRTVLATGKSNDGTPHSQETTEDQFAAGKLLVSHGYIFAVVEVRGTGASFGYRKSVNSELEAQDGFEICQWMSEQSWCDGNLGTFGYSYYGATQMELLRKHHKSLKACFIGMTDFDKYDGWVRGGSLRAFGTRPDHAYLEDLRNVPVGEVCDEKGKHMLEKAVSQHRFSTNQSDSMRSCPYRDSWCEATDTKLWENISHSTYLKEINNADTAVYLYGGWRDVFRRDTVIKYRNLKLPKKMLFGPWHHMDNRPGFDLAIEKLRFFDYWLKKINNGIMEEPPIYYSIGNMPEENQWHFANDWPLTDIKKKSLFFAAENESDTQYDNKRLLAESAPEHEEAFDEYLVNYDIHENVDNDTVTEERDAKGVTYTTLPLTEELKVVGHPMVDLWISSSTDDGDFFVHLIDVDENGKGTYISDGKLRASLRSTAVPPYDFAGLPWHRCYKEDEHKMIPQKPYRLQIDLLPMSHLFKKGHKIRITVTCACGKIYFIEEKEAPIIKIYRDAVHTSYLTLPIITD